MKIIKLNNHLYDAFVYDGWENWSRWNKDKRGFFTQVGGPVATGFIKNLIIKKLSEIK